MNLKERIERLTNDFQKHKDNMPLEDFVSFVVNERKAKISDLVVVLCKEGVFSNLPEAYRYLAAYYKLSNNDVENMRLSNRHFDEDDLPDEWKGNNDADKLG